MFKSDSIINTTISGMREHKQIEKTNAIQRQKEFLWLLKG